MAEVTGAPNTASSPDPFRSRPSRRTVVAGAAWAVPAVVGVNALPAWATSPESATVCPRGVFKTTATGRLLSGSLLSLNLDTVAAVNGVTVTDLVSSLQVDPPSAVSVSGDVHAFKNPLNVTALNTALELELTGLSGMLQLPLNNDTGVLGQYAKAVHNGFSAGASGFVNDNGVVATAAPAGGWPELATVDLYKLVNAISPATAALLGLITNLKLKIGAVAGRAQLDACPVVEVPTREYLLAYVKLVMNSPALATLVTGVNGALPAVQAAVNGLAGNTSVLSAITTGVNGLLGGLLSGLGTTVSTTLSATVDLTGLDALLTQPFGDDGGLLLLDPDAGTVEIDLTALAAAAYPGTHSNYLNGLAANTNLVLDATIVNTLTGALTNAIDGWLADLDKKLFDLITVNATVVVNIKLLLVPVAKITLTIANASLTSLLNGSATVSSNVEVLGSISTSLLDSIVSALVGGLAVVIGNAIKTALSGVLLTTAVSTLVNPVVTQVANLVKLLFIDQNILKLVVNAQNVTNGPPATDFDYTPGVYEVAALWLSVLPALANGVNLYLARASAGQNVLQP